MIITSSQLNNLRNLYDGYRIVLSHGCFDLFHIGHLNYLIESKKHGDLLVVSVTNDVFVDKGSDRPIFNINDRISIIDSLKSVDYVCISNDHTCINIIKKLKPNVLTKGIDVKGNELNRECNLFYEKEAILSINGELIFIDSKQKISSSKLLKRI